jgi:hypothetical protein
MVHDDEIVMLNKLRSFFEAKKCIRRTKNLRSTLRILIILLQSFCNLQSAFPGDQFYFVGER